MEEYMEGSNILYIHRAIFRLSGKKTTNSHMKCNSMLNIENTPRPTLYGTQNEITF